MAEIYRLKTTLKGSKPPIWRRLEVSSESTLPALHKVLQAAMGWWDCHLHAFIAGGVEYGVPDDDFPSDARSERRIRLKSLLKQPKDRLHYQYDFGDGWELTVVLEAILEAQPGVRYPVCSGGKRAAPPEDCGGIYGFYDLLAALADDNHPEHSERKEWIGREFDPAAFDVGEVNGALRPTSRRLLSEP